MQCFIRALNIPNILKSQQIVFSDFLTYYEIIDELFEPGVAKDRCFKGWESFNTCHVLKVSHFKAFLIKMILSLEHTSHWRHCSDCRKITTTCSSDRGQVCRDRHFSAPSWLSARTLPSPSLTVRWHCLWPTAHWRPAGSRFCLKSATILTRTATRRSRYVFFLF